MLSRVADSIYWLSRYVERAENIARFIDVNLQMMLDLPVLENEQWQPLVTITADEEKFLERYGAFTQENVVRFLAFDPEYPNSIVSCVRAARENARSVRDVISSEMWEQMNRYYLLLTAPRFDPCRGGDLHDYFTQVRIGSQLFGGITDATMSHGEGWHFARAGRLLERADKTSRLLDVKYFILLPRVEYVGTSFDQLQWAAVLKSAGALEMYRKSVRRIAPQEVAEFLIFDREFPRALRYCLSRAAWSLHEISGGDRDSYSNEAERRIGMLRTELDYARLDQVFAMGLHQYLDDVQRKLNDVGDAIHDTFFSLRKPGPPAG
jgi:uncharacterized alpha-E superfamily protein